MVGDIDCDFAHSAAPVDSTTPATSPDEVMLSLTVPLTVPLLYCSSCFDAGGGADAAALIFLLLLLSMGLLLLRLDDTSYLFCAPHLNFFLRLCKFLCIIVCTRGIHVLSLSK